MKSFEDPHRRSVQYPENPYLAARREWLERYGDVIALANNWRITAFLALLIAAAAVCGALYLCAQSRYVPYVVEVDRLGDAVAVNSASVAAKPDERLIRASLARWIVDARSVYMDAAALRRNINELYAMLGAGSPAALMINDYFRNKSPFERAQAEVVSIEIKQTLPVTPDTWRVEWNEDVQPRGGGTATTQSWAATLTFAISAPTTQAGIISNPAGLYIRQVSWSQRL